MRLFSKALTSTLLIISITIYSLAGQIILSSKTPENGSFGLFGDTKTAQAKEPNSFGQSVENGKNDQDNTSIRDKLTTVDSFKTDWGSLKIKESQQDFQTLEEPEFILDANVDLRLVPNIFKVIKQIINKLLGWLGISKGNKDIENLLVRTVDIDGQLVKEFRLEAKKSDTLITLDTKDLKPGKYHLEIIEDKTQQVLVQDFTWGVLAINPDQAIYQLGQESLFSMAVLNNQGKIICNAQVDLTITDPKNNQTSKSTSDNSIQVSDTCKVKDIYQEPDYSTTYRPSLPGTYNLTLTATHDQGSYTIKDFFQVQSPPDPAFIVKRNGPTRVFPVKYQPMKITITAQEDFKGIITESLPQNFQVERVNNNGDVQLAEFEDNKIQIRWPVDLRTDQTIELEYYFKSPEDSPAAYLLGPLTFHSFKDTEKQSIITKIKSLITSKSNLEFSEPRFWQLAIDAPFMYLFWDGGTAPTGWSTDITYDGRFVQGEAAANFGNTGGNSTHTHTTSSVTLNSPSVGHAGAGANTSASYTHSHGSLSVTVGNANNLPSFRSLKLISNDTGIPTTVPQDSIALFDDSPGMPGSNWTRQSAHDNYLIRVNNTVTTGGADSGHTHSLTWPALGASTGTTTEAGNTNNTDADDGHTHTAPSGTTTGGNPSILSPYIEVVISKSDVDQSVPKGLIAMFDSDPGTDWTILSNSGGDFYQQFLRGAATYNGTSQGSSTHSQGDETSGASGDNGAGQKTKGNTSAGTIAAAHLHNHTITASFNDADHTPEYFNIVFAEYTPVMDISGNIYTDEGSSALDCSVSPPTVAIKVNGTGSDATPCTNSPTQGYYAFTNISAGAGDILTIYVSGDSVDAVLVTEAGTSNLTNANLFEDHVIVRHDNSGGLTIDDMNYWDKGDDNDDIFFTATSGSPDTLVVDDGQELYVWTGDIFAPGGNLDNGSSAGIDDIKIVGTYTAASGESILVSGTWNHSGTFTSSTSTVTFDAGSTTEDIFTTGTGAFNNVVFNDNAGSATFRIQDPIDVDGNFTITGGTVDVVSGENNQINIGGNWTNDDIFDEQQGTVVMDTATAAQLDSNCSDTSSCTNENFYSLQIDKSSGSDTVTLTNFGIRVLNTLTITTGTLVQGAYNIQAEGSTSVSIAASGTWSNISTGDIALKGTVSNSGVVTLKADNTCGSTDNIVITEVSGGTADWAGSGTYTFWDTSLTGQNATASITVNSGTNVSGNTGNWTWSDSCPATTMSVSTTSTTIQVDVPNRYQAIMTTNDTAEYLVIKDRAQNDGSPNEVIELQGSHVTDEDVYYRIRQDNKRKTTLLESSDVRARIRVEGCLDTTTGDQCLTDGTDVINVIEEYTFTLDGFTTYRSYDFHTGITLDDSPTSDAFRWMFVFFDETDLNIYSNTIITGTGETETERSTDASYTTDHTYAVYQATGTYQDVIIGVPINGHILPETDSPQWRYDAQPGGGDYTQETWLYEYGTAATILVDGYREAKWYIQLHDQNDLDSIDEREGMVNDLRNPDVLSYTTGVEWDDTAGNTTLTSPAAASPTLEFDGIDDFADVTDPATEELDFVDGDNFSISFWFYPTRFLTGEIVIAKMGNTSSTYAGYSIVHISSNDELRLMVADGDGTNYHYVRSTTTFTSSEWNHITFIYDDSAQDASKLFVNGVDDNANNQTGGTFSLVGNLSNSDNLRFGSASGGADDFGGKIDDVRIYETDINQKEVIRIMTGDTTAASSYLVGHWDFNENTGDTAHDNSSYGNIADLAGSGTTCPAASSSCPDWSTGYLPDHFNEAEGTQTVSARAENNKIDIDIDGGNIGEGSILFDDGSNQYLERNTAVLTATPLSMAGWFYTDDATAYQAIVALTDTSADNLNYFSLQADGGTAGDPVTAITADGTANSNATSTTGFSTNTWHHACGVFAAANDRAVFLDGGSKGVSTVSRTPSGIDGTSVGRRTDSGSGQYMSGRLAEVAIWNAALSDAECQQLANGYKPSEVNTANLVAYWPLYTVSDLEDKAGNYDLTAYNSPTTENQHPWIYTRHNPYFKVRNYRDTSEPTTVTLEGVSKAEGSDYIADIKPFTTSYFAQDLVWHTTFESSSAFTSPDVGNGTNASVSGATFTDGRYGNGILIDAGSEYARLDITTDTANFDKKKGAIEFWFQPDHGSTDNSYSRYYVSIWEDANNEFRFRKDVSGVLQFLMTANGTYSNHYVTAANYFWKANDWIHFRIEWDDSASVADQAKIYMNGKALTMSNNSTDYNGDNLTLDQYMYIGNGSAAGTTRADGIIDEFRIYDLYNSGSNAELKKLSEGGYTGDADEYLADTDTDYTFDFNDDDTNNRGEYFWLGSDSWFQGVNISLATIGLNDPLQDFDFDWEYWNGTNWSALTVVDQDPGTHSFRGSGTFYFDNPGNWFPYSVNGSVDLYFIRGHLESGDYSTNPVEDTIETDILFFSYLSNISSKDQTLVIQGTDPPPISLTTDSIQIDVPNRYRAIVAEGDTTDYVAFYDRLENDSNPDYTHKITGVNLDEGGTQYHLRYNDSRQTTILESNDVRVRIRVEGCLDTTTGGSCVTDGTDVLWNIDEFTFTQEGVFVQQMVDFKTTGIALDASPAGFIWLGIYADETNRAYNDAGNMYYGDGETETSTSTDGAFEDSNKYVVLPGANNYQSVIVGIQRAGWTDIPGGTDEWYWDENQSGIQDLIYAAERSVTATDKHYAKYFFSMQPQANLDSTAEREGFINDHRNPDYLTYTTGSQWWDASGDTALSAPAASSTGLEFDNTDDYVDSGYNGSFSNYTAEAWIYLYGWGEDSTEGLGRIFDKREAGSEVLLMYVIGDQAAGSSDYTLRFNQNFSGGNGSWAGPANALSLNRWYHVAVSYDASDYTNDPVMYVNGVSQTVTEITGPPGDPYATNTDDYQIGNRGATDRTFDGIIDEFRLWSDIRTATEIKDNMNMQVDPSAGNLELYYRFNENTGTTTHDETANDRDGTLTNGPVWTSGHAPDHYNEAEGTYTIDMDSNNAAQFDIDGGSNASSTLSSGTSPEDTTVTVADASNFDADGTAYIEGDRFTYTSIVTNTFQGVPTSGEDAVLTHSSGAIVSQSNRHDPFFKYRNWRDSVVPPQVDLEGVTLTEGTDYTTAIKPFTTSYFAQDLWMHYPLEDTTVAIGDTNLTNGGGSFESGRYGKGFESNADGNDMSVTVTEGTDYDINKGIVEFWYKPYYDHDDNSAHNIYAIRYDVNDKIEFYKNDTDNSLRYEHNQNLTNVKWQVDSSYYSWSANDWVHFRIEWDDSEACATQQRVYINGVEPSTHSDDCVDDLDGTAHTNLPNQLVIGNKATGDTDEANGIIDEFKLYDTDDALTKISEGGDIADSEEYLYDSTRDYTFDFNNDDDYNRGEYVWLGSEDSFQGVNIDLATDGTSSDDNFDWEYWDGTGWSALTVTNESTLEVDSFEDSGYFYFTAPGNWFPYSVNGSTDQYFIRGHLEGGSYSVDPIEDTIQSDIVFIHYIGSNITADDQTLLVPENLWMMIFSLPVILSLYRKRKESMYINNVTTIYER
jgi:hypothetical protein